MAGLRFLLPMPHPRDHSRQRMVQGQSNWLSLLCRTLPFPTPSRFIPAISLTRFLPFSSRVSAAGQHPGRKGLIWDSWIVVSLLRGIKWPSGRTCKVHIGFSERSPNEKVLQQTVATEGHFLKRRRPDSNRGWRICNQTTSSQNPQSDKDLGKSESEVGALGGALETKTAQHEPDLQTIIDAWPTLPDAIKAGILAMVKAASDVGEG